jgi:methylmalonyl-CoA mutase cobalamin-binding subunit
VHVVGLSILSGSHLPLVKEVLRRMRELGVGILLVVVGGVIPPKAKGSRASWPTWSTHEGGGRRTLETPKTPTVPGFPQILV